MGPALYIHDHLPKTAWHCSASSTCQPAMCLAIVRVPLEQTLPIHALPLQPCHTRMHLVRARVNTLAQCTVLFQCSCRRVTPCDTCGVPLPLGPLCPLPLSLPSFVAVAVAVAPCPGMKQPRVLISYMKLDDYCLATLSKHVCKLSWQVTVATLCVFPTASAYSCPCPILCSQPNH